MITVNLVKNIQGYFTVSVYDSFAESALNDCTACGINVWNVRRNGRALVFCVSARNRKRFEMCMAKNKSPYEIIKKTGVSYTVKKYKHRYALALGAVFAAAFMFFMSSFIWSIKINGNVNLTDDEILKVLDEFGFREGTIKKDIDYYMLYQKVILKKPEIAWMAINIKGTRAEVEILERVLPPIIDDTKTPSDIVASESGVIEEIKVYAGTPLVKVGQAVEKGDVLVSSAVTNLDGTVKYVSAKAEIKAKTLHALRYICPDRITEFYETGKEVSRYKLKIFNFTLNIGLNSRISMARYDKITEDNQLRLGEDYYLPIHLICSTYKELYAVETPLDEDTQLLLSQMALEESLDDLLPYAEVTSKTFSHYMDGVNMVVIMEVRCTENIALKLPISEEKDE